MDPEGPKSLVGKTAALGVDISETQAWEMLFHLEAVLKANERLNLTAITEHETAVERHILDSIALTPCVLRAPDGSVADLGSGAGYPGIPIAIASARPMTLVESIGKKAHFLQMVCTALDHDITVYPGRAEELSREQPESFACVTGRAVARLASLVELSAPLLQQGGMLLAPKRKSAESEELPEAQKTARLVGMELLDIVGYQVSDTAPPSSVFVFARTGESSVTLPRKPGLAQKRPIGA
ncbi:MAG: 16S rRNA (guanine(527)-N(7))-methyltransferase RsmG [Coriobacteriia bacterium]